MIESILGYLLLGTALGLADRSGSEWLRHGRERREAAAMLRALRYLLQHYKPASFELDCQNPEYREAVVQARRYYQRGAIQTARRLQELLARTDGRSAPRAGALQRARAWLERDRIGALSLRRKAALAAGIVLALDLAALVGSGLSAGLSALLRSLVEAPALLAGLWMGPWASRSLRIVLQALGRSRDLPAELQAVAAEIEKTKRSLHLRLGSAAPLLPGEEPERLPPTA
jgi:hypothetical protein